MKRFLAAIMTAVFFCAPLTVRAAAASDSSQQVISKLQWRSIGPFIGGRVVAVAGVPSNPNLFYMGGVHRRAAGAFP